MWLESILTGVVLGMAPCYMALGATSDPLSDYQRLASLTGKQYYYWEGNPLRRAVFFDGHLVIGSSLEYTRFTKVKYQDRTGRAVEEPFIGSKEPTASAKREALRTANDLVARLSGSGGARGGPVAPLDLLVPLPSGSLPTPYIYPFLAGRAVRDAYASNPSRLLALTYAELALLRRDLRQFDELHKTLLEANEKLGLERLDFRADDSFRRRLPCSLNFGRPETCLLYLLAEECRRRSRTDDAVRWYKVLVRNDPSGPYSWESLVRLRMLPGAAQKDFAAAQEAVMATYPGVWGCVQDALVDAKITKDKFAEMMPALIEQVIAQVSKEDKAGK